MLPGFYLNGSLASTLELTGAIASPLELLLILIFCVWLGQGLARRKFDYRGGTLGWPMAAFVGALLLGLLRGMATGGNFNIALWESRFLFYIVMCYMVAANTVRTRKQVQILTGIAMFAIFLFALEGAWRRVALIDTGLLGVVPEFAYSHEDVIFLGTLLLVVLAQWVFGAPAWMKFTGLFLMRPGHRLHPAGDRAPRGLHRDHDRLRRLHAGVPDDPPQGVLLRLVVPRDHRRHDLSADLLEQHQLLGQPARAVRSLSQARSARRGLEPVSRPGEDQHHLHDQSRIRSARRRLWRPVRLRRVAADLSWWPFWHYEPHHNILWVWLKLGTVGFIIFWSR